MNTVRPCGCKGVRTCLWCEKEFNLEYKNEKPNLNLKNSFIYCPFCKKLYPGWHYSLMNQHPNHTETGIDFDGVYISMDFLSEEEEEKLVKSMDGDSWQLSQCGRRKQNFGPKCNFNKKKLKVGEFNGFPSYLKFVQDKFKHTQVLKDFQTIEQCAIEYDPSKGAWIPPHIDDCWIWGNRIVTVNLLSDSVLTLTLNSKPNNYNLSDLPSDYLSKLVQLDDGKFPSGTVIRIPMPNRSLLVLFDAPRYLWEHQILREDIANRRICLAYREFTPFYLNNDKIGVIDKAKNFF